MRLLLLLLPLLLVACADPPPAEGEGEEGEGEGEGEEGEGEEGEGEPSGLDVDVGVDDYPCDFPAAWPIALKSELHAMTVHIRDENEREIGEAFLAQLEDAWDQELALGFPEPPTDAGLCGDDDDFDAFLFRNSDNAYVDFVDVIPETDFADVSPYMVLDWEVWPDPTVAHELNHAMQASCDWGETAFIYESTSQFIEEALFDDDNIYRDTLEDFQDRADLALDHDDGYATFYMYGASFFLHYLDEAIFPDEPDWIGRMWIGMRSEELLDGSSADPDVLDVMDSMIEAKAGMSFLDAVVEFTRWRYYVASKDDGAHFSEAGELDEFARVPERTLAVGTPLPVEISELGSRYFSVSSLVDVVVDVGGDAAGAEVVVQAIPGLAGDGDVFRGPGPHTIPMIDGARVVSVTLLPPASRLDPDLGERPRRSLIVTATAAP